MPSTGGAPAPVMNAPMPQDGGFPMPADNNPMQGAPDPMNDPMGDPMNDPMGGPMGQDGPNPYKADFDAGVEADEESDPKKFIQQLTGKLSQSLRKYNETLPQPDIDLDKYVAGMVVKQCLDGLSPEDAQDILSKVKVDGDENNDQAPMDNGNDSNQDMPADDNMGGDMNMPPMNEDFSRNARIDNIFQSLTADKTPTTPQKMKKRTYSTAPYMGKIFK